MSDDLKMYYEDREEGLKIASRMIWLGCSASIIEDVIGVPKEKIKEIKVILEAIKGNSEKIELNKKNQAEDYLLRGIDDEQIKYNIDVDDYYIENIKKSLELDRYGSLEYYKKQLQRLKETTDEIIYVNIDSNPISVDYENKKEMMLKIEAIIDKIKNNL